MQQLSAGLRGLRQIATVLCALLAALPGRAQNADRVDAPPVTAPDLTGRPASPVLDVRAGNVVVVRLADENRVLRLIGVYVPNSGTAEDAARPYLSRLLQGESVYVAYEANWPLRDREDRYWAYVYRMPDGLFVNLELIRLGYARLSAIEPFEHQTLFRAYEQLARKAKKGLWHPDVPAHPEEQVASQPTSRAGKPAVSEAGESSAPKGQPVADDTLVFITPRGRKYHRQECPHARNGATAVALKDAKARGCTPCSTCRPPD